MKSYAAAVLAFFIAATASAEPGKVASVSDTAIPAFAEAAATVDAFHLALSKGDRERVQALLDDKVQIYEQGWVERSKAEYAAHHLASDFEFSSAVKRQQTARSGSVSGDIAYVTTEDKATGKFKGKDVDSITLETMVLRRFTDGWKIVHIHWSSRNAKTK